jgi:hypothetical protein
MKNSNRLIYFLALIKFVLPFLLQNSFYQPHRDEFLYLAEGHHMAWGYMEVPPLLSVFAWLTNAFGSSIFWIKIWPALFGALTFLLIGKMIIHLGGKTFALLLGLFPFVFDGYIRLFFLFHANFLDVFFWTLIAYSIFRFIQTNKNKWLYIFGIAVGLGMMSKYSVAFYTLSILAGLTITQHRKVFLNKHLYYAALIALLIFLPNIIWQYNHRFPIVQHMKTLEKEQLQHINTKDFLIGQVLMNFPCLYIWLSGLLFTMFYFKGKQFRIFGWAYACVIILLIVLQGKDYYALGAYPVLFALGAYQLEQATNARFRWTRYAMVIFSIGLGLFAMPLTMPLFKPGQLSAYYHKTGLDKTGAFKWEDQQFHPLPQDFADMIGWKETAAVYNGLPAEERTKTLIYCRGYYFAAALNYYRKELALPEVYSDNASFLLWMPDKYDIKNLILIAHTMPDNDDIVFQQFEKVTVKDSLVNPLARENGIRIILFENGNDKVNPMAEKAIDELKNKFRR